MAGKSAISHVRWDPHTLRRIDAFADERKLNRSAAIRILVGTSLGDPAAMVTAREAAMIFSTERRPLMVAFADAFQTAVADAVTRVLGTRLTQPPDLSMYAEGGVDGLDDDDDDDDDDDSEVREGPPTRPLRGLSRSRGRR